jgi:hypothetical protein
MVKHDVLLSSIHGKKGRSAFPGAPLFHFIQKGFDLSPALLQAGLTPIGDRHKLFVLGIALKDPVLVIAFAHIGTVLDLTQATAVEILDAFQFVDQFLSGEIRADFFQCLV